MRSSTYLAVIDAVDERILLRSDIKVRVAQPLDRVRQRCDGASRNLRVQVVVYFALKLALDRRLSNEHRNVFLQIAHRSYNHAMT